VRGDSRLRNSRKTIPVAIFIGPATWAAGELHFRREQERRPIAR
jgi:hypothetical protein